MMYPKILLTASVFLLTIFNSFGQYGSRYRYRPVRSYGSYGERDKTVLKRFYIGMGLPFTNLQLNSKLVIDRSNAQTYNMDGNSIDTSIYLNAKCTGSYGCFIGFVFPLAKMSDKDMIAVDLGCGGTFYSFDFGSVEYSPTDIIKNKAEFYLFDMPVGLVYKNGGEVSLDGKNKFLFSIGAGFSPTIFLGGYNSASNADLKTKSFLTSEIGAYAGLGFKLRATWYPAELVLVDDHREGTTLPNSYGKFDVKGMMSSRFVLSLVVLPYSTHWRD